MNSNKAPVNDAIIVAVARLVGRRQREPAFDAQRPGECVADLRSLPAMPW
jgi:hypothetical protein